MKKYAVIVAGGVGNRMQSDLPKQFMLLNDKPVLYYTIQTFLQAYDDIEIILVLPEHHLATGQEIIDAYFDYKRIKLVVGGPTRFHSTQNGLQHVLEESVVFVHDAVRCLLSVDLIHRCYDAVLEYGSAIPVVSPPDSVRQITEQGSIALKRDELRLVQTPQAFYSKLIVPAFNIDYKDWFTDEASVAEAFGMILHLVEGEKENIKITHPLDMKLASVLLENRK